MERFAEVFAAHYGDRLEPQSLQELESVLVEADGGGYNPRRGEDLRELLPWREAPSAAELEAHWLRRFPHSVVPMPGLEEVLEELTSDGWLLGIVTNGGVTGQNAKIDRLKLRRFMGTVIVSEAVGCKKPDPRIFELACDELGVRADDCWFVGDHAVNDVVGAARFGMRAVWITYESGGPPWPEAEAPPAHRVESLLELPGILSAAR